MGEIKARKPRRKMSEETRMRADGWVPDRCPGLFRNLHTNRLASLGEIRWMKSSKQRKPRRKNKVTVTQAITAEKNKVTVTQAITAEKIKVTVTQAITAEMVRKAFSLPAHATLKINEFSEADELEATWEEIR